MSRLSLGLLLLALLCVPAFADPVYYQFNLAALGDANADANTTPADTNWFFFHQGEDFTQANVPVPFASLTADTQLQSNDALQSVPFSIGSEGANESWSAFHAPGGNALVDTAVDLQLEQQIASPTVVFLMMNTFWGRTTESVTVQLSFQSGETDTYTLYGNSDLRDHNDAPYYEASMGVDQHLWTNQIDSNLHDRKATVNEDTYNGPGNGGQEQVYRDVVALFIDPRFANDVLTQILIRDLGHAQDPNSIIPDSHASRIWLWGVTVASDPVATPEPSTWLMLTGGLAAMAFFRRRRG